MREPQPTSQSQAPHTATPPAPATFAPAPQVLAAQGRVSPQGAAATEVCPQPLSCLVLTTSDTRTMATDRGGAYVLAALEQAGHQTLDRRIVADDITAIRAAVLDAVERQALDVLVITGGTSLSLRDVTPEAVVPLFRKTLPGFGEALRRLAWDAHGPKAVLTRAAAGVVARTLVFLLPGTPQVVQLAMDRLVVPVMADGVAQLRS